MDPSSLQNASTYLNNLLLARGLLRNGKTIDFDRAPAKASDDTPARIINLVHDLVIRRDRDADQRESFASNIRSLRAEEAERTNKVEQLKEKNVELQRQMAGGEASRRTLEAAARKADASVRDLKEQMAKMKSQLDQVRARCVNDVRKRDMELEKLKKHVTTMQRGAAQSSGMKILQLNPHPSMPNNAREYRSGVQVNDQTLGLEQETNGLLAALVNETSTENVMLRHIVDESLSSLKELTGLEAIAEEILDREIGIPGQYKQSRQPQPGDPADALTPCDELREQMTTIINHCRAILKDPSFVSIEEVQVREEEILKLREGWEKMAIRWKDAMAMIDAWRKRMVEGGNAVDLQELSCLSLSKSMAIMPSNKDDSQDDVSTEMFDEEPDRSLSSFAGKRISIHDDLDSDSDSSPEVSESPPMKRLAASPARRGIRLPRPIPSQARVVSESDKSSATSSTAASTLGSSNGSLNSGKPQTSKFGNQKRSNSPPLSVQQKLALIEAEAKEAAAEQAQLEAKKPHKRTATDRTRPKRNGKRRSTLSPDELANLMGVR